MDDIEKERRTGLTKCLVIESGLADLKCVPLLFLDLFVDVDNIQVLILQSLVSGIQITVRRSQLTPYHPELVTVLADQHGPVLRRIRVLADPFGDLLAQARLLGEPFAGEAGDGVPSDLHCAIFPVDVRHAGRYDIRLMPEPKRMLEHQLALEQLVFASA